MVELEEAFDTVVQRNAVKRSTSKSPGLRESGSAIVPD